MGKNAVLKGWLANESWKNQDQRPLYTNKWGEISVSISSHTWPLEAKCEYTNKCIISNSLWTFAKAHGLSRKITVWCNRRNMCFCSAVRSFYRETILGILRGNARFLWPCLFEAGKDLKIITYIKGNLLDIRRLNTHAYMRHIKTFL